MALDKKNNARKKVVRVTLGALLFAIPITLLWSYLFPLHPAPNLPDIAVELLFSIVTLIVYAMIWSLGINALRLGGGLFLVGIYTDALTDIFLTPAFVDIYICQGLQLVGMALFAWSTYHHYNQMNWKMARLHEDFSQMQFRATHDSLTKLPNRLLFRDRLLQSIAHAKRHNKRLAVHYLDLNNLKEVNDTHGHATGDHLLWEIAQRLQRIIRSSDTASRLGGDEFAIIQTEVNQPQDARQLAVKLLEALNAPVKHGDKQLWPTASIGISIFPEHSENIDDLIGMADGAMYQAKQLPETPHIMIYQGKN